MMTIRAVLQQALVTAAGGCCTIGSPAPGCAVTAVGGTHICLRSIDPANIFHLLASESVTHMAAAPVVLSMLIHAPADIKPALSEPVQIATGGAAPPSKVRTPSRAELRTVHERRGRFHMGRMRRTVRRTVVMLARR